MALHALEQCAIELEHSVYSPRGTHNSADKGPLSGAPSVHPPAALGDEERLCTLTLLLLTWHCLILMPDNEAHPKPLQQISSLNKIKQHI